MEKNLEQYLENFQSLNINSLDENNIPFSSYAPFVRLNHKYYVYLSAMAKHSNNLNTNPKSSLFFIEDESACKNIFARKRVMIQCDCKTIKKQSEEENTILNSFENKFDKEMVKTLRGMNDFQVFEFTPFYGEAVFGFGAAYNLGGDFFEEFVERNNTNNKGHGHK